MLISKFSNTDIKNKIEELEKEYGIVLPHQYKNFLSKYNGGYTPKTKLKSGTISSDIRGFYGIGDVELSMDTMECKRWLDARLFLIACDSFGNYIAIGVGDGNHGKIYFCDHEKGYRAECIADNLKAFVKCCKSEEISDASRRSIEEREQALIERGRGDVITDDLRQMWQKEIDKYGNMVQEEVVV